jgi:hypothetical protein
MYQRTTSATVAVAKRVDRLKLRVDKACLNNWREISVVYYLAEVIE